MTLFKQIATLVSVVFLLLLTIVVVNDLRRASEFQQGQLQTAAQDMVTTLGIAISNLPDGADPATLEVLFNAVFDSGYYTRIELIGTDGQTIHRKSQSLELEHLPRWFVDLVPLSSASGSTGVMQGWVQLGRLELDLHPGFAYQGLYDTLMSTLRGLGLLFVLSLLVLWLLLRFVLAPLGRVREQADAIRANRFVQQETLPATTELKRVVEAMNLMVAKVKSIFDDQEATLAQYQQLLYRDKLTNLGNRRYLLDQLQQSMSEQAAGYASMAIVKVDGFEHLRDHQGYEVADNLVRIVADLLRQPHAGLEVERVSRFNDDEFSFLSSADEVEVGAYIQALFEAYRQLVEGEPALREVPLLAGIGALETGGEVGKVLADIDYCLSQASTHGPFSIEHKPATGIELPEGKMQWRAWLEAVLESGQLFLVGQLALGDEGRPVQRELFVRARNAQNQIVPASVFMPMASSLGMSLDIDREVFRQVAANKSLDPAVPLAINLSAAFFELAEAQEEFDQLLFACEQADRKLCIEASHPILLQHPLMCGKLSERVRRHRHQFGIDNLDLGLSLQILQSGQFDYVKINAQTLQSMGQGDASGGFQALKTITDTLDIDIVAVGVDSQEGFDRLRALGIGVMQGNFLDSPEAI